MDTCVVAQKARLLSHNLINVGVMETMSELGMPGLEFRCIAMSFVSSGKFFKLSEFLYVSKRNNISYIAVSI